MSGCFVASEIGRTNYDDVIAVLTFFFGVIALLVWLYVARLNTSTRTIMLSGLWYFLLAIVLGGLAEFFTMLAVRNAQAAIYIDFIILAPLIEESVKVRAAASCKSPTQIFALITLFGIYELMLVKPLSMLDATHWSEAITAIPAVTMHIVTATIYAFHWDTNLKKQFAGSASIHAGFNAIILTAATNSVFVLALLIVLIAFVVASYLLTPIAVRTKLWRRSQR